MQMSISLNNSTVFVLVKSTKVRANSNSNSKLELDDFEPSYLVGVALYSKPASALLPYLRWVLTNTLRLRS